MQWPFCCGWGRQSFVHGHLRLKTALQRGQSQLFNSKHSSSIAWSLGGNTMCPGAHHSEAGLNRFLAYLVLSYPLNIGLLGALSASGPGHDRLVMWADSESFSMFIPLYSQPSSIIWTQWVSRQRLLGTWPWVMFLGGVSSPQRGRGWWGFGLETIQLRFSEVGPRVAPVAETP